MSRLTQHWRFIAWTFLLSGLACNVQAAMLRQGSEDRVVQLTINGQGSSPSGTYSLNVSINGQSRGVSGTLGDPSSSINISPAFGVTLNAEATYQLNVGVVNFKGWGLNFIPPSGYKVYINGILSTGFSGSVSTAFEICLHSDGYGGAAGVPSQVIPNPFFFSIGLGNLSNGQTAGALSIFGASSRQLIGYPTFSPEVLYNTDTVALKTVLTPQTFVYATDITSGYQLDFYPATDASSSGGVLSVKTGATPYVSYQITAPASGFPIQITRYVGGGTPSADNTMTNTVISKDITGLMYTMDEYGATMATALRTVTQTNVVNSPFRYETTSTSNSGTGQISSVSQRNYESFDWTGIPGGGLPRTEVLVSEIDDPGDPAAGHQNLTTTYNYDPQSGQLNSIVYPTLNWVAFDYFSTPTLANGSPDIRLGQVKDEYHPWLGSPSAPPPLPISTTSGRIISFDYAPDWFLGSAGVVPARKNETINGVATAQQTIANTYPTNSVNQLFWMGSETDYSSSGSPLTSIMRTFSPVGSTIYAGLPSSKQNADGTMDSYGVIPGVLTLPNSLAPSPNGLDLELICLHGLAQATTGAVEALNAASATIDPVWLVPNQSTESITYRQGGLLVREEDYVYTTAGFVLLSWVDYTNTPSGNVSSTLSSTGAATSNTYFHESLTSSTDANGIVTNFTPDGLLRVAQAVKTAGPGYSGASNATPPSGSITTTYSYDSDDNLISTQITGGGLTLSSSNVYDAAGRLKSQTDANALTTSFTEQQGGLIEVIGFPNGGTRTNTAYLEGTPQSVTGSAQVAQYFSYTVDSSTGFVSTTTNFGTSNSGNWSLTQNNWQGQKVMVKVPNTLGGSAETDYTYNALGQLSLSSTSGIAPTHYYYTAMGALEVTDFGMNGSTQPALSSSDMVTQSDSAYMQDSSHNWWLTTTNLIYAGASSPASTIASISSIRQSGFSSGLQSEVQYTDADGNITDETTIVNPATITVAKSTSTTGISNASSSVIYNGLLMQETSLSGVTTSYGYDGLGRNVTATDPRSGTTTKMYYPSLNEIKQVSTVVGTGSSIVGFSYDSGGRVSSQTDPGGNVTAYGYDAMNHTTSTAVNGAQTAQFNYNEDAFGRLQSQLTYFGSPSGTSSTTFGYFGDLSLVESKTDASGKASTFTYDSLNRVSTKTDARGAVTTLGYDPITGYLSGRTYTGLTTNAASVALTYNRNGTLNTVADTTGTRTFAYWPDMRLHQESLPAYFGTNRTISYVEGAGSVSGRLTDIELGIPSNPGLDQDTNYAYYATDGRLQTIAANGNGFTNYSFTYNYTPNSDRLISSVVNAASGYARNFTYDPNRDLVGNVTTSYGATTVAAFAYQFNLLGQRSQATESGSAFSNYGASPVANYLYDQLGQLTSAQMTLGGIQMPGRQYVYSYDSSGNRLNASHTGNPSSFLEAYTPNSLNQIASKENTTVPVQGTVAAAGSTVAVQNTLAGKAANYWGSEALLYNANGENSGNGVPALGVIPIYAGLKGGGTGGGDIATQTSITAFIGPLMEIPSYDLAGNLLADGRWNYTWDSENQLITIETTAAAQQAGLADTKVSFSYDYLGRRVQKVVSVNGAQTSQTRYVYAGWNVMAELDASGNVLRHFIWGPDIDGTIGGVGGVGGLVMIQDSGHTYMPAFDGNGDVTVLIDASNGGAIAAKYEYSPFGELLQKSGSYAIPNPFRWSTKWTDDETSLVYYGHRYYNAATGRFISRDPIGEAGGMNLYGFCGNDGINRTDMLGLDGDTDAPEEGGQMSPISSEGDGFGFKLGDAVSSSNSSSDGAFLPPVSSAVTAVFVHTSPGKRNPPPGDKSSLSAWPSKTPSLINATFPDTLEAALEVLTQAGYTLEGGSQNGSTVSYTLLDPNGNDVGSLIQNQFTGSWAPDQTEAPNSGGLHYDPSQLQPLGSGYGSVYNRMYQATIQNGAYNARDLMNIVGQNLSIYSGGSYDPLLDLTFQPLNGSSTAIQLGNLYGVQVGGTSLVNAQVAVTALTDTSFTFTTMQGHPEAGSITFSASQGSGGAVIFTINSIAQSSSAVNDALYHLGGQSLQTGIWTNVLNNVIQASGGTGTITTRITTSGPP